MYKEEVLYESKWKQPYTVDDMIKVFTEIKERFGGDMPVSSFDEEMYYQDVTLISVQRLGGMTEVRIDTV